MKVNILLIYNTQLVNILVMNISSSSPDPSYSLYSVLLIRPFLKISVLMIRPILPIRSS